MTDEQRLEILRLWRTGTTVRQLAGIHNVGIRIVQRWIREALKIEASNG